MRKEAVPIYSTPTGLGMQIYSILAGEGKEIDRTLTGSGGGRSKRSRRSYANPNFLVA